MAGMQVVEKERWQGGRRVEDKRQRISYSWWINRKKQRQDRTRYLHGAMFLSSFVYVRQKDKVKTRKERDDTKNLHHKPVNAVLSYAQFP